MRIALYGLPCAGKTTIFEGLTISVVHGSTELNRMASGRFSDLPDTEKTALRTRYAEQLKARTDSFISDGHYSFLDDVAFTDADGELYDVFIYLYCESDTISKRLKSSDKNRRFAELSVERIRKWQNFEIESLRAECHKRNKDFYVVKDITADELQAFIDSIENGFSSYKLAEDIANQIMHFYPQPCDIHICDGDKTIIEQDSFRVCTGGHVTHVFDGNFYTGYQAFQFTREAENLSYDTEKLSTVDLNETIFGMVADKNYVILSSGIKMLWKQLAERFALKNVIADTLISADTKSFVAKLLQEKGYTVTAYGDGKNDYYMLKQADRGYLYIGKYFSRSLRDSDLSGLSLVYDRSPYILADIDGGIADDIAICKSNSGINGAKLAAAHIRLGRKLGEVMRGFIPNINAAVIVLERGGRFFGDGVYTGFGGTFYSYNPKADELPDIQQGFAVIVDSVINTGKSVLDMVDKLKQKNPDIEIAIVSNVIQKDAVDLMQGYKVFAIRTSANSFVGSRQAMQKNGKGPDTADRLFNYID